MTENEARDAEHTRSGPRISGMQLRTILIATGLATVPGAVVGQLIAALIKHVLGWS
jgi:hypothetical protein